MTLLSLLALDGTDQLDFDFDFWDFWLAFFVSFSSALDADGLPPVEIGAGVGGGGGGDEEVGSDVTG